MVFESIVTDVLNKALGEYVENLDSSQLKIGIWGGDVVLTNLVLKQSALDDLNLPVKTVFGILGKLVLKIPWKNLYSSPTEASIEKLFLLVVPNQEIKYDPEKEEKWKQEAKQAEIEKVEAAKKRELEKDQPKADDTFAEKLVAQIVRNVQISIKDIHIRYEDRVSNPSSPFSLGITLHNLTVITTDKNWQPAISQIGYIFKHLTIDGLSLYWNSNCDLFGVSSDESKLRCQFEAGIPSKEQLVEGYKYLFGPISCAAKLQLNMKPEADNYKIPKALLTLEIAKVFVRISKSQYSDVMALLESLDRMSRASMYRKYRPDVQGYKGNYKAWWKYAYTCILEEEVRRRRKNWDWLHIVTHRKLCRNYAETYQNKLLNDSKQTDAALKECEKQLDAFNIVLIRKKIEVEVEREGQKALEQAKPKGWFSGWWGAPRSESDESKLDIKKQLQEAMTKAEKEKLFKAIGYQENISSVDYPREFVGVQLKFSLDSLIVEVRDDQLVKPEVMVVSLKQVTLECDQRPSDSGLKVHATMYGFTVAGLEQNNINPQMCECLDHQLGSKVPLVEFMFETSPLDNLCDTHVEVEFRPLRIVYDAQTIIKLIDIFTPEEDKSALVYQLQMAANMKLAEMKEKSALGLQYTIQQHSRLRLKVNVMASHLIIPQTGFYSEDETILVYNLGRLSIESKMRESASLSVRGLHKSGANEDEILGVMLAESYDKFNLKIENMQIIIARPGEDWMHKFKDDEFSELHLLHPTSLIIEIHKCLVSDDPRLPKLKITGTLPNITIKIQETRLFDTISLLLSIPFSEKKHKVATIEEQFSGVTIYGSSSSVFRIDKELEKNRIVSKKSTASVYGQDEELVQFTDLDAKFTLNEILIEIIADKEVVSAEPFLKLSVMKLEANLVMQTYNMSVDLFLGGLSLTQIYEQTDVIRMINTPMASGETEYLFVLKYLNVDKESPDFHSHHKSVVQLIDMNFSKLNVLVHQEALLYILHWLNNVQCLIAEAQKDQTVRQSDVHREEFRLGGSGHGRSFAMKESSSKLLGKKSKKKPVETIDLKLKACVAEVGITLANKDYKLARMELAGAVGSVLMKRSYTQIDAKVSDFQVVDFKNSVHPKILSILGKEELISLQLVLFNEELQRKTDSVNMSISATVACIRVVFLNRFLTSLMNFMNNFQVAQEAIKEASAAAAEAAKVNMQQAYSAALKIKLNINLHAPVVVIPVDSQSYDAILVDFGKLTIKNSFQDISVGEHDKYTAVLDHIQLSLENVKVSRIVVGKESFGSVKDLLEPISFQLLVQRNLSAAWFTNVPDLDVSGHFHTIMIKLHRDDYTMIMTTLSKNFGEVDPVLEHPTVDSMRSSSVGKNAAMQRLQKPAASVMSTITEEDLMETVSEGRGTSVKPKKSVTDVTTIMKFTFRLESLIIELSQNDKSGSGKEYSLAKLEIYLLSLRGAILSDGTYTASALLLDFLIDDTRPSQQNKINRYMERVPLHQSDLKNDDQQEHHKSMIDATFRMKDESIFVDFRVFSFVMILNLQHLLKLAEFFSIDAPDVQKSKTTATASSTSHISTRQSAELALKKSAESVSSMTVINLCIEKPDIILVESLDDISTNALILEMETIMKIRLVDNSQQVVTGTIKDLQMFTCCYDPARRQDTKAPVLRPVSISLAGSTPQKLGLHLDLCTTNIHLSVSPGTIELLNTCYNALYSNINQVDGSEEKAADYSDVWEISQVNELDYWFLKSEEGRDALDLLSQQSNQDIPENVKEMSEICLVSVPSIVITLEAGIGNHTLPMLLLECSVKGTVHNWSSQLTAEMLVTLQVGYYNSRLALWEPLIEPLERVKHGINTLDPWELTLKLEKRNPALNETTPENEDVVDGVIQKPPLMTVTVTSEETMEMSVTKTCLEVLQSLGASFNEAIYKPETQSKTERAPYIIQNDTGLKIIVLLRQIPFQIFNQQSDDISKVLIEPGGEVSLCSIGGDSLVSSSSMMYRSSSTSSVSEKYLVVEVKDTNCVLEIPISRAEKRYFVVKPKDGNNEQQGIICDVSVKDGSIFITLCSIIRVYNHFKEEVSVFFMTKKGNEVQRVNKVPPNDHLNLPVHAVYTPTNELFFSVSGYTVSLTPFVWKDLQKTLTMTKLLQCNSKNTEDKEPFFMQVVGEMEQVFFELSNHHTMASTCYNLHLHPTVILKNFLPVEIMVCVQGLATENTVASGERIEIPTAEPGSSSVVIRISEYLDKDWSCKRCISENPPELEVWTFESYDAPQRITFDLGMHSINKNGSLVLALYCPFWMLNKTGLSLCYRRSSRAERTDGSSIPTEQSDDLSNILYHPENFKVPVMFSFRAKNFFGKKKACIKVQNGEWSEKFSLDVAGSFGVVNCKVKDETYQIGVHIELTYNTLTKQVTFTPYHILVNNCSRMISCCEANNSGHWIKLNAGSCEPFYPVDKDRYMVVRIRGTTEQSVKFPYDSIHTSLLKLDNKFGGINVDVHMTEGAVYIYFNDFKEELAPALIMNHTQYEIQICEKYSDVRFTLPPVSKKLFCWSAVTDNRQITWVDGKYSNDLYKDDIGEFSFPNGMKAYFVSFLNGMQRVFLFTTDLVIAREAQNAGDVEVFDQELLFSIHGIGLSLVDNLNQCEILYIGITSSGIIWEVATKQRKRFKHLPDSVSDSIEDAYQKHLHDKQFGNEDQIKVLPDKTEVDFERGMIIKPQMKYLRRTYNTGLWVKMKTSKTQFQLHAKVNRLQIDNQMYDCVFPVVLAPVPPPKSVSAPSVMKPFAEVSIVQRLNEHTTVKQYKYYKVLIQEFHIKVDIGFINAIINFFEAGEVSDALEAEQFAIDRKLVDKELMAHVTILSSQQQKNYYDFLHFSPLKIHLSFSLSGGGNSGISGLPPVFSILTQSLGVTLTDMQDVVFKLSYFERQCTFLSQRQLMSEVQMHYVGQFFKQVYVLVFGLDVLGNPYGLVVGLKQGVEDLFYEPFQGAIQGPGEFAEGFYLGVRSLFGHTIGGAAGAMSRITGAMGKGLAALTFDEEYQKKRREQLHTAQSSVQESMAQSGKGLVMGVVHGFGGVFTKPISGAKEEGVEGFFKGFGKGMVGLVTRPTAGVVDFASGTFSSVRRIAQLSEEVSRMRNPRQFKLDRLVRPYSKLEAEGQRLLMEIDKGRLHATDAYVYHIPIGQKDILLVTDKRIAYLGHNDVFGGHQIDWSYTWGELAEPPNEVDNGIVISMHHSKKKFFKSGSTKKLLLISNPEQRQIVLSKIQHCMSVYLGIGSTTRRTSSPTSSRNSTNI